MKPDKKPWTLKASRHNDVMAMQISRVMILGQLLMSRHAGNRMLTIVVVGAQSTVYILICTSYESSLIYPMCTNDINALQWPPLFARLSIGNAPLMKNEVNDHKYSLLPKISDSTLYSIRKLI